MIDIVNEGSGRTLPSVGQVGSEKTSYCLTHTKRMFALELVRCESMSFAENDQAHKGF